MVTIESINDELIKNEAKRALDKFKSGELNVAAIAVRIAFDKAFFVWRDNYHAKVGMLRLENQSMQELIRDNVLDINLAEYNKFDGILPEAVGDGQFRPKRNSYTPDELKFCIDFFIKVLIIFKKQVEI